MDKIGSLLKGRTFNVNVDKDISKYVYDENVAIKIREALDKPKAIAEDIAEKLGATHNVKLYISLVYKYPIHHLYECLALTKEAHREGRIRTSMAQYFYGIVKKKTYG